MTIKRLTAALAGLLFGLALASCSSVSGYVSDTWPHWAGGLPAGVPPRPGAPGYDAFIAHQQSEAAAAKPVADPAKPVAAGAKTDAQAQPPPSAYAPSDNPAVARGGLY